MHIQAGQGEALPAVVTTGAAFLQVLAKALEVSRYGTWGGALSQGAVHTSEHLSLQSAGAPLLTNVCCTTIQVHLASAAGWGLGRVVWALQAGSSGCTPAFRTFVARARVAC